MTHARARLKALLSVVAVGAMMMVSPLSAQAQGTYRSALIDFGLPGLTQDVVLQFEAAGIPQEGLAETTLRIFHQDATGRMSSAHLRQNRRQPRENSKLA